MAFERSAFEGIKIGVCFLRILSSSFYPSPSDVSCSVCLSDEMCTL